ncbi:hypothetical protein [Bdellovibrio sp. HCB2-146]|uniref:hypothetical protein n=1 Tax=Bdellovibrio sp. HCB2-146 TaxID=3394362 RepID=UPI0039BC6A59
MRKWLGLTLILCLSFGQMGAEVAQAQIAPSRSTLSYDYDKLLNIATQIQTNKLLYDYLNIELAPLLEISPAQQALFQWGPKSKGLSESQLVAILQNAPELLTRVESYMAQVSYTNSSEPAVVELRAQMKKEFEFFVTNNPDLLARLKVLSDPTQAFTVTTPGNKPAMTSVETFVNHPIVLGYGTPEQKTLPAADLKAEVIKFINGAQSQVWANFYDFDLMDVAETFAAKAKENVDVSVGVDSAVVEARPEVKAVAEFLESQKSAGLDFVRVSSVGLNHMKMIVRDPNGPNAAVMFLSGNLTQSCIGKEGDLKNLPPEIRPKESIPNANHAIIVKGTYPAIFARHQLHKVLKMKIRGTAAFLKGNAGFPIGGAYKFFSAPTPNGKIVKNPWMIFSFSPNGGMGDINTDILKQVILTTTGPVRFLQFAFSSKVVTDALALRISNEKKQAAAEGRSYVADIGGLGDQSFTHRDFSSFLTLDGLVQDKVTGLFSVDPNGVYNQLLTPEELEKTRAQTYSAPAIYGEKTLRVNGEAHQISSKIHHKIMIIPDFAITTPGTSFNYSVNAESNNEQIVIMRNEQVTDVLMGAYEYLRSNSRGTVYDIAMKRNSIPRPPPKPLDLNAILTCEGLF